MRKINNERMSKEELIFFVRSRSCQLAYLATTVELFLAKNGILIIGG